MTGWLVMLALGLLAAFGFVLLFGAPYLPTLRPQITAALNLAALQPGDHLLELGCGDGRVLVAAARRGYRVTGYELNPLLLVVCWLRTRRYRRLVRLRWANFWQATWPPADAVFTFLLPKYMSKLDTKVAQFQHRQGRPVCLISFAFPVPHRSASRQQTGLFRYDYR